MFALCCNLCQVQGCFIPVVLASIMSNLQSQGTKFTDYVSLSRLRNPSVHRSLVSASRLLCQEDASSAGIILAPRPVAPSSSSSSSILRPAARGINNPKDPIYVAWLSGSEV
jgi:hypothetical protein